ncbi:Uncharacterised protein [Salmonella enterica]|nr:Uncharacterised protein [Salmonella enterica]
MKHSFAVKLAAVHHYMAGNSGIQATAAKFHLSHTHLTHWINLFRLHGHQALSLTVIQKSPFQIQPLLMPQQSGILRRQSGISRESQFARQPLVNN